MEPVKDHLNFRNDPQIMKLFNAEKETLLYSGKVIKFNRFEWKQERNIVITNKKIYNYKKKSVKRKIAIEHVEGITKSKTQGSLEFVIHVPSEYDYRYAAEKREEIIDALKRAYQELTGMGLKLYGVFSPQLRNFTTSKKDQKKGLLKIPHSDFLIKDEAQTPRTSFPSDTGKGSPAPQKPKPEDEKSNGEFGRTTSKRSSTIYSKQKGVEVSLDDFEILKVLGKGTFGKVFLVEKKHTKELYAMKSLRKDVLIDYDQLENTKLEKEILLRANHPFLVSMDYVFQTDHKIFFVMRFVRGGELFKHLEVAKRFPEEQAKFYAAQVALAVGHLHKENIIYRDIKPENILVDHDGYICLADFGLAKIVTADAPAMSFCGTPEYLAPEVITGEGHSKAVDWWSLGILTYEMIVGIPPFLSSNQNDNNMALYERIRTQNIRFPDAKIHGIQMTEEAKDFIKRLLEKSQKNRLGSKGIEEVLGHPFFASINFDKLLHKELNPPMKPKLTTDKYDVSNFDKFFTTEEPVNSLIPESKMNLLKQFEDDFKAFNL